MSVAICFEHVSKRYRIGAGRKNLRETISAFPGRLLGRDNRAAEIENYIWAVKDVSIKAEQGKVLGIIGPNGAGKTTMLKLISKVTKPTSGQIQSTGRVSALIELGAGFHPDLTGRENVYLNGVILGLSKRQIDERFDSIMQFAELERFIDTPVKRYSSGMYARLGFAVAAHVDPDILLVDEVLAVGDEAFQLKCHEFIHSLVRSGRTSIFVSHNLYAIEQLCDRVVWLDHGKIIQDGAPSYVLKAYMDETDRRLSRLKQDTTSFKDNKLHIRQLRVTDVNGIQKEAFSAGEDLLVSLDFESNSHMERPFFCIWISDAQSHQPLIAANMLLDNFIAPAIDGRGTLICHFKEVPLMPRAYNVWVEVYGKDRAQILYKWRILGGFRILDQNVLSNELVETRGQVRFTRAHAPVKVFYEWRF